MNASTLHPSQTNSCLILTGDPLLLDELTRRAAAAGATLDQASDAGAALPQWSRSAVVLLGADRVDAVAMASPPRRPGVYVVSWGPPGEELFRPALAVGAEGVVELPGSGDLITELLTDLGEEGVGDGAVVGVLGGSGGAGATTFAAALAQMGASEGDTVLLDADPLGPGVDSVLGLESAAGVHWAELAATTGRLGARALREALPGSGALRLLTWDRSQTRTRVAPEAAREVLSAARRGHRLVVLDLPRTPDDVGAELMARCDLVVMVVRASVTGVAAAARLVEQLPDRERLRLVLRGSRVEPEAVSQALRVPVLTVMADQRGLAESIDLGMGPVRSRRGPLGRAARDVLARCRMQVLAA